MKCILAMVGLSFLIGGTALQPVFAKDAPASEPQLLQEFETALKAKDQDAILSLFNWQGVSAEMKLFYSQMIGALLKLDVTNVVRSPFPENFPASLDGGGVHYALNVSPAGVLEVQPAHRKLNLMELPYGRKDGAFYIAGLTEELTESPTALLYKAITVQVQTADGRPLPGRAMVCASPDKIPNLQFGRLFGGMKRLRSDDNGQLTVPLDAANLFLVAAEPEGFGWIQNRDLTNQAVMVIRPWGRIEGVRMNRNQPVADEHLRLLPDRDFYGHGAFGPVTRPVYNVGGNEAWTDSSGRFTFEHVPPLGLVIVRQDGQGSWTWPVEVNPGGTNRPDLTMHGRTVAGHVKAGPGLDANIDLAACSGTLVSDMKDRKGPRGSVKFSVSTDGSIHAEGVEPGDYKISGELLSNNVRVAELETISVHVPAAASEAETTPFDMGTATLKAVPHLLPM